MAVLKHSEIPDIAVADNITVNLLGGITPLFALLGQEATNRYLSQSVSFMDTISFIMVPTGVPFAVFAINRIARFACRRESNAAIERELLSSTSKTLYELWDGQEVKRRVYGSSERCPVEELICIPFLRKEEQPTGDAAEFDPTPPDTTDPDTARRGTARRDTAGRTFDFHVYQSQEAKAEKLLSSGLVENSDKVVRNYCLKKMLTHLAEYVKSPEAPQPDSERQEGAGNSGAQVASGPGVPDSIYPPNLSLNLGPYNRRIKSFGVMCIGIVLQIGIITLVFFTTIYEPWAPLFPEKFGYRLIAFLLVAVGYFFLLAGLAICAQIIGRPTNLIFWKPQCAPRRIIVVWVQDGRELKDTERFIVGRIVKKELISSHCPKSFQKSRLCSAISVLFVIIGFLIQVTGLALVHWPAQTLQLLSMSAMFILRSLLHRQDEPDFVEKLRAGEDPVIAINRAFQAKKEKGFSGFPYDGKVMWKQSSDTSDIQNGVLASVSVCGGSEQSTFLPVC